MKEKKKESFSILAYIFIFTARNRHKYRVIIEIIISIMKYYKIPQHHIIIAYVYHIKQTE